jgi:hypothetical protein
MELLVEKTEDEAREKRVPVVEKIDGGYRVKVGSVARTGAVRGSPTPHIGRPEVSRMQEICGREPALC